MQQPIYWATNASACSPSNPRTYQAAWCSSQLQSQQGGHPEANLESVFGKADRVADYQSRMADSIDSCGGSGDMGAQSSFAGDLMENLDSIGAQNAWGFSPAWASRYASEAAKTTSGGFPKLDLVQFTSHHMLLTLAPMEMVAMDLRVGALLRAKHFGLAGASPGLFPAEMQFTERAIPTLVAAGVEWVVVADNHISRACRGYPFSATGDNIDPPNPADQLNPPQARWFRMSISRGCAPNNAVPFAITPHRAQYVDPTTGNVTRITVVPAEMALSWQDGYECLSAAEAVGDVVPAGASPPARPPLLLLAHDGDNAFGGGYSYYMQCVPGFVNALDGLGARASTVQQYLHDFPVPEDDVVKVEDGGWVNKAGDFGSPQVQGWNWPPTAPNGTIDIPGGYQVQPRQYAVVVAALNFVLTAAQTAGLPVDPTHVAFAPPQANEAEIAWHFLLPSMTSGYEYYGNSQDMPDKPTLPANMAVQHARAVLDASKDETPPSVLVLNRFPYNPGGQGAGALWGYKLTNCSRDFFVYTFAFDVSGIASAVLYVRAGADGRRTMTNEVYGASADWKKLPMSEQATPPGDMPEWNVKFDILPAFPIASKYFVQVAGFKDVLLDYFAEFVDKKGNMRKTDIFHVFVN